MKQQKNQYTREWQSALLLTTGMLLSSLQAQATEFKSLPVKSIPEGSSLVFKKEVFVPANASRVEISEAYDLSCYLEIHPVSNRSRVIREGSLFYIRESSEDPPSVMIENSRNTLMALECEPRMTNIRGGSAESFYREYAYRLDLKHSLSIESFELMFKNHFTIRYSEPIEIEANARVQLKNETPPQKKNPPVPTRIDPLTKPNPLSMPEVP